MNTARRIDLRTLAAQPWKNGAGLTREIACGGADAARFDWRLSVAEVEHDAPFSTFPGIDRCIVLLRGAGLHLRSADGSVDHPLTAPLMPFRFPGDLAIEATTVQGASSDFNVMTRRGVIRSEVTCHRDAVEWPGSEATLALCVAGEWRVGAAASAFAPMQALLWRESIASRAEPLRDDSTLLLVRLLLCQDRRP